MISIEAFRARIGCFFAKRQKDVCNCKESLPQKSKFHRYDSKKEFTYPIFLQLCIMFLFLVTLGMNINMAFLKLSLLLLVGDIEINPGPGPTPFVNKIQKVVLGNFHQGNLKFGNTAGVQCACNALFAICFSVVKKKFSLEAL